MENKGEIIDADLGIKMGKVRGVWENWERQSEEKRRDSGRGRGWKTKNRSYSLPI